MLNPRGGVWVMSYSIVCVRGESRGRSTVVVQASYFVCKAVISARDSEHDFLSGVCARDGAS